MSAKPGDIAIVGGGICGLSLALNRHRCGIGDCPYDDLEKYITPDELRALSENYQRIAGFAVRDVGR